MGDRLPTLDCLTEDVKSDLRLQSLPVSHENCHQLQEINPQQICLRDQIRETAATV
jgi:hypothetical protein